MTEGFRVVGTGPRRREPAPLTRHDLAVLGLAVAGCAAGGVLGMLAVLRATGRL